MSTDVSSPAADLDQIHQLFEALESKVRGSRRREETGALRAAFQFAMERHGAQRRRSGELYILHPLQVAGILADMQMDMVCLITSLLHDVLEDTNTRIEEVRERFGEDVARCVDGVTKLSKLDFYSREERQAESVRKMLLAMTTDVRVVIVKLADRLHNMLTLNSLERDRQVRIAQETQEIYAPIAHRLGMGKMRHQLENLAFVYLEPEAYQGIKQQLDERRAADEEFLATMCRAIEQKLAREGIVSRVEGRVKEPYSVYQKIKRQKIDMDQVYDRLALRIITDSVKNCYGALGIIHGEWHPIPGRIKDFIAMPRPNLYQSLHTSVMGPQGTAFEVQIRTEEMHRIAEEGIAAHWKYKEGRRGPSKDEEEKQIAWLRQLVEWQQDVRDPGEFISTLKVDLYPEEVYCFTPRGRVIALPRGGCPIDFAYAIHSDVGNTCVGAKVNGRIVQLRYQLKNGDVVEILTQPGHTPSKDWLGLVKTSRARNKIKHFINAAERAKAIEIGEKYLEREARRLGVTLKRFSKDDMERVASDYGCSKIEDLHAALGYGKLSARTLLQKLAPDEIQTEPPAAVRTAGAPGLEPRLPPPGADKDLVIKVRGIDDVLVYRAQCCNPIRGEEIVGYVSRGKGVAVHSTHCPNVQNLMYEVERKIDVEWSKPGTEITAPARDELFPVRLLIHSEDKPGILNHFTSILAAENSNIRILEARPDGERADDHAIVDMTIEIRDKKQLERIVATFRRVAGVRDVNRLQ